MNKSSQGKKSGTKKPTTQKTSTLPEDRVILDTLYKHYGQPADIVSEKVKLYKAYRSPAGWSQDDWVEDGYQMGRVTIFVSYKANENDIVHKTKIPDEGFGSWFIGVKSNEMKVWIGGKLDATLKIEVKK